MKARFFIVRNIRTGAELTIEGKTLFSALVSNGLRPEKWLEVKKPKKAKE